MPFWERMSSGLRHPLDTDSWNHLQYQLLASQSKGKSSCTALIFRDCFHSSMKCHQTSLLINSKIFHCSTYCLHDTTAVGYFYKTSMTLHEAQFTNSPAINSPCKTEHNWPSLTLQWMYTERIMWKSTDWHYITEPGFNILELGVKDMLRISWDATPWKVTDIHCFIEPTASTFVTEE
jgi:hypothetical protein